MTGEAASLESIHMAQDGAITHEGCPTCSTRTRIGRRGFLGLLGIGAAAMAAGYEGGERFATGPAGARPTATHSSVGSSAMPEPFRPGLVPSAVLTTPQVVDLGLIPEPHPGPPQTVFGAPSLSSQIALTIDDGYCAACAEAYLRFAEDTGLHITFSPNGIYGSIWNPLAERLQALIQTGQVQMGNHTYTHANLVGLSNAAIQNELVTNDDWIQKMFGITTRPWFRPPYGYHNARVDEVAGDLGYTRILMWDGTFGDSTLETPAEILALAHRYLQPGTIVLGHANYPTVMPLLPQIYEIITDRGLNPVTLDEMFGTSRNAG